QAGQQQLEGVEEHLALLGHVRREHLPGLRGEREQGRVQVLGEPVRVGAQQRQQAIGGRRGHSGPPSALPTAARMTGDEGPTRRAPWNTIRGRADTVAAPMGGPVPRTCSTRCASVGHVTAGAPRRPAPQPRPCERGSHAMTARTDQLHRPQYMPDLLIRALDRNADRPALHLGETTLTADELRDAMSRYVQALASLGVGKGTAASMLARNRPEVLISMGSTIVAGCRNTALNPTSALDDHAYIVDDAQIEMIVFDPRHFEDHVAELVERCPSLTTVLSLGPSKVGTDILALAEGFEPAPLVAAEVDGEDASSLGYTGGTTGRPKGGLNTFRSCVTLPPTAL